MHSTQLPLSAPNNTLNIALSWEGWALDFLACAMESGTPSRLQCLNKLAPHPHGPSLSPIDKYVAAGSHLEQLLHTLGHLQHTLAVLTARRAGGRILRVGVPEWTVVVVAGQLQRTSKVSLSKEGRHLQEMDICMTGADLDGTFL